MPFRSSFARLAMISLAFMLYAVPAPAWKTSSANWPLNFPSMNSWQACWIARECSGSRSFKSVFALAAASFTVPSAIRNASGADIPLIWKFFFARAVNEP